MHPDQYLAVRYYVARVACCEHLTHQLCAQYFDLQHKVCAGGGMMRHGSHTPGKANEPGSQVQLRSFTLYSSRPALIRIPNQDDVALVKLNLKWLHEEQHTIFVPLTLQPCC